MKILTIDIGSTNIKFAVFIDKNRMEEGKIPFPLPYKNDCGKFEINARQIVEAIITIADKYPCEQIRTSVQMHGYVVENTYVSWRDRRVELAGQYENIKKELLPFFTGRCGTAIKPNTPAVSLFYRHTRGEKIVRYQSLGAYIAERLTGNDCSHITDVCASGFYQTDGTLNEISKRFPLICSNATINYASIGKYKKAEVFPPIGDQQASLYPFRNDNAYLLNIGTASQLCVVSKGNVEGQFESRPFFGKTLCTITGLVGGAEMRTLGFCALEKLKGDYKNAVSLLPKRNSVTVLGGAIHYHKELIIKAIEQFDLPISFKNFDALDGLIEMEKE